jgi:protein-glutamine gamma-glutamyltransferase
MNLELRFAPLYRNRRRDERGSWWRNWWHSWAFNRLKPNDTHRLTLHNVYVLPTRAGWMMLVTLAVLLLATINYQLNLGYVLIFLLMGAGIVALYLAHRAMTRITLRLDTSKVLQGIAGEDVEVTIQVTRSNINSSSDTRNLSIQFDVTGPQPLPLLTCETRYPLGLLRLWSLWRIESTVQINPPQSISNAIHTTHTFLTPTSHANLDSLDPIKDDFRAYRVGDAPRDVLWKTVAKRPDSPNSWGVRERDAQAINSEVLATTRSTSQKTVPPKGHNQFEAAALQQQHNQQRNQKRDQLLLCVLLAIALPFFVHLAPWYPLLGTLLIGVRLWLVVHGAAQAPPKWLQLPLIAGLGALIWLQLRTFNGIEPSVSACVGLLGIKALELPNRQSHGTATVGLSRDRWVLVFLGIFTLAAHFLVSQSLLSSALVVLGLIGLIYVLVDAHGSLAKWRTTATLVLLGAPIMLVLFFLFPRFAPLWTLTSPKSNAVSGLSNDMRVGDIGRITLDNRITLRLAVEPGTHLESKDIYLRGPVLPYFDGRTWKTYVRGSPNIQLPPVELDWEVPASLDSNRTALIPPFGYTIFEEPKRPEGNLKAHTGVRTSDLIRNNAQSISSSYLRGAASLPAHSNPKTQQWLRGLQADSRYARFTTQDWSTYLLTMFRNGGFRYSLEPGVYGEHLADELLFDRPQAQKLGFCEHYASTYVVAMRHLGIPARIVTGYQGAEINPVDGLWVVRNKNAHAWAEYWEPSAGWLRVDPTSVVAPERIQSAQVFSQSPDQARQRGGISALSVALPWLAPVLEPLSRGFWTTRQTWEATSHAWEDWMQNYQQDTQLAWLKNVGYAQPTWRDLVQLLIAVLLVWLGVIGIAYTHRARQKKNVWLNKWLFLLQAAREQAVRAGAVLAPNASPQDIGKQLSACFPGRAVEIATANAWLMQLERARYQKQHASKEYSRADLATLKRSFKQDFCDPLRTHS